MAYEIPRREVRLGLVMYGGVSLAIYINGVSREFFELVRGTGVYGLLKTVTHSDVVIDILSGTSAGGINAILLAYALTNQKNFAVTADLWRRDGDLESLLRSPYDQHKPEDFTSVLDGEFYRKKLEDAFECMDNAGTLDPPLPRPPGTTEELDLFITGTNVSGHVYTTWDDLDHPIDVKDHRTVFHLKHRPGRKHPFSKDPHSAVPDEASTKKKALAKLARLTSSFPVAFTPVTVKVVTSQDSAGPEDSVDYYLTRWGQLDRQSPSNNPAMHFMDGGLLDNKPFTYTIREIFNRTATREISRYLVYVEPDPEQFKQDANSTVPTLSQAAFAGAFGIPTYETIADDLQLLTQHNEQVERHKELAEKLEEKIKSELPVQPDGLRTSIADCLQALTHRSPQATRHDESADHSQPDGPDKKADQLALELAKLNTLLEKKELALKRLRSAIDNGSPPEVFPSEERGFISRLDRALAVRSRLSSLRGRALQGILKDKRRERHVTDPDKKQDIRKFLDNFEKYQKQSFDELEMRRGGAEAKKGYENTFKWFDVYFRIRRLTYLVYKIHDIFSEESNKRGSSIVEFLPQLSALWHRLNRHIEYLQVIQFWMEDSVDIWNIEPAAATKDAASAVWETVVQHLGILLTSPEPDRLADTLPDFQDAQAHDEEALTKLNDLLRAQQKRAPTMFAALDFNGYRSILELSDDRVARSLAEFGHLAGANTAAADTIRDLQRTFAIYADLDALLYPMEYLAGLAGRDDIGLIRLSPLESAHGLSKGHSSDAKLGKLAGRSLAHFGGFLKESWRANDLLWGRFDAADQIISGLLQESRIREVCENDILRNSVRKELAATTIPGLTDWINQLTSDAPNQREAAYASLDMAREAFIADIHANICREEIAPFLESAVSQQLKWQTIHAEIEGTPTTAAPQSKSVTNTIQDALRLVSRKRNNGVVDSVVSDIISRAISHRTATLPSSGNHTDTLKRYLSLVSMEAENVTKAVPPLVLSNLLLQAFSVLRNCLMKELPEARQTTFKGSWWYRKILGLPLDITFRIVRILRAEPIAGVALRASLLSIALGLIVLQCVYGTVGHDPTMPLSLSEAIGWWIVPAGLAFLAVRVSLRSLMLLSAAAVLIGWLGHSHLCGLSARMAQFCSAWSAFYDGYAGLGFLSWLAIVLVIYAAFWIGHFLGGENKTESR